MELMTESAGCQSNYWLQTLLLDEAIAEQQDVILEVTNDVGLMIRLAWRLKHHLPAYQRCPCTPLPLAQAPPRQFINTCSRAGLV